MDAVPRNQTSSTDPALSPPGKGSISQIKVAPQTSALSLSGVLKTAFKVAAIALVAFSGQSSASPLSSLPVARSTIQLHYYTHQQVKVPNMTLSIPIVIPLFVQLDSFFICLPLPSCKT